MLCEDLSLVEEVADLIGNEKDRDKLAQYLVYTVGSRNQAQLVALAKALVSKEISQSTEKELNLADGGSMAARVFGFHCQLVCTEYLKSLLAGLVEELTEAKEELKPNSDALMEHCQKILSSILKSLLTAPP